MDATRKASLEAECQRIRADLKGWEHQWSSQHGAKPSRNDIKATPDIAKKYKDYNRLRDVLSGKLKDSPPKRKASEPAQTPVKRTKHKAIPEAAPVDTPSADKTAPSPAPPTSIGPTPHRDGKVLGLFAFLDSTPQKSPSKRPASAALETPSKPAHEDVEAKLGRTPGSISKRRYLDDIVTPLKATDGNVQRTPTSVSKLQFGTPRFLRRRAVEEMPEFRSPEKLRKTSRRPFARGLSAIVAGLRRVEEETFQEAFDDDEEAMREMEGGAPAPAAVPVPAPDVAGADIQAQDTQAVPETQVMENETGMKLLGGFDDEGAYDSPTEEVTDRGRPMREFKLKKKGQKRTTRRVNMKPTFVSRPAEEVEVSDEEVPETQVDGAAVESNEDGDYGATETRVRKRKAGDAEKKGEKGGKEGTVRKAARKVNELAHANFRRLKMRGNGKGGGGRFRRR